MGTAMKTELVTIVIPTFDEDPAHLREAVASAMAQTHPHLEVIMVDDGSTHSGTLDALRDLETSVLVVRQSNRGPSAARNAGISHGHGEYVICLDADDILSATYATEGVQILTAEAAACAAYPVVQPFGEGAGESRPLRGRLTVGDFAQRSAMPVSAMFRRADWERIGCFDESMRTGMEDHEWWIRLLGTTQGFAHPMPYATLHYRVRSTSRSKTRAYADDLAVTRERILANNPSNVLRDLLEGAWAATDVAEAEAARAWSDPWQLRRWGRAIGRRARAARAHLRVRS